MPYIDPNNRNLVKGAGRASAVGWEMAIAMIGGLFAGWWADEKLGTEPWLTFLGLTLGSFVGFRALFRVAKLMGEEDDPAEADKTKETDGEPPGKGDPP
jgi:ATP synthase protein I